MHKHEHLFSVHQRSLFNECENLNASVEDCSNCCLLFLVITISYLPTISVMASMGEKKSAFSLLNSKQTEKPTAPKCRQQYKMVDSCFSNLGKVEREIHDLSSLSDIFPYFLVRRKQPRVPIYLLSAFLVKV